MTSSYSDTVSIKIGPKTKFIISTSGRLSSMQRYNVMLQDVLSQDIAYIRISSDSNVIQPQNFVHSLKGMNCIGGAISKDIKNAIIPFLDFVDPLADQIQSVNTVIVKDKMLHGYNTDVLGFRIAIIKAIETYNLASSEIICKSNITHAVCYGYGGVTSVVVKVLESLGIKTYIIGRRMEEAKRRAIELNTEALDLSDCSNQPKAQLFINAAPVTDKPLNETINFLNSLKNCSIVFDHEMPGKYLKEYCLGNNIAHISGTHMYYPQMIIQWKLFLNGIVPNNDDDIISYIKQAEEKMAI